MHDAHIRTLLKLSQAQLLELTPSHLEALVDPSKNVLHLLSRLSQAQLSVLTAEDLKKMSANAVLVTMLSALTDEQLTGLSPDTVKKYIK